MTFDEWQSLLSDVINAHSRIIKPGGFMAVNIGDILCFPDESIPRFQADNVRGKKVRITREEVLAAKARNLARTAISWLPCSDAASRRFSAGSKTTMFGGARRRLPTKVLLTGCMVSDWAEEAGFYLYDQRIWHKDPCWSTTNGTLTPTGQWTNLSTSMFSGNLGSRNTTGTG